jgi:putative SOS response-associated peptidase YedK
MCGRFTLSSPIEAIQAELPELELPGDYRPRFNIAPTQLVLAVRPSSEGLVTAWLRWGLIPYWAGDPAMGNRFINARAETLARRPAFRDAFRRRRCWVLADGYYEWVREGPSKRPMRIRLADGRPFAMAGLWERWYPRGAEPVESCTLVTTDASPSIAALHDRMPVILPPGARERWLDRAASPSELGLLLQPYAGKELEAYAVSTLVNSPANDVPDCLAPI